MKKLSKITVVLLSCICIGNINAQNSTVNDSLKIQKNIPNYKFFGCTTWHTFLHSVGKDVEMYELHIGYRLTPKDVIAVKAATWKLFEPMGIQLWNPKLMQESEWYNGRLWEYGIGLCYQRNIWKGLFAAIEIMPMKQEFISTNNLKIASGFKLYTSYHIRYYIPILKNRFFIQPQIHCNYWPIHSNGPEGFKEQEAKYDNFFLFEPNVYLGVNF